MIERLERFLADAEPGRRARVLSYQPISGGYSRISARASVRWADGREETLILRGDPPAGSGVFVSDRDAEWELLRALPNLNSVATAPTRWYDSSGDYLGAKCIVMQSVDATSLQAVLADANDTAALRRAFDRFAEHTGSPMLVVVNSIIGYGAPTKQGTASAHSEPLGRQVQ